MDIDDILLKKEELPILRETCFYVPVHPILLRPELEIDQGIARRLFPQAAQEWYEDLKEYAKHLEDSNTAGWYEDVFLKYEPKIDKTSFGQVVIPSHWEDGVNVAGNGLVTYFSISRNSGGSLYLPPEGGSERREDYISPPSVLFSKEKFKAFDIDPERSEGVDGVWAYVYLQHNVDYYPGALFLRNWAVLYLNEAIRSVDEALFNTD